MSGVFLGDQVGRWAGGKTTISKVDGTETFSNMIGYVEDYPTQARPCINFEG